MSTLLTPRRRAPQRRPPKGRQESLFGALPLAPARPEPAAPAAPEPEVPESAAAPAPVPAAPAAREHEAVAAAAPPVEYEEPDTETSTTARAHRQGPTLDDLVAGAWEGLLAGAPATCPVCESTLTPRYSAGAGVVGGRCGGCGSTFS
jgi:hypothetical protein